MNTGDDQTRLAQRFLQSLRADDIGTARIQIEALHDVTPPEPGYEFKGGELVIRPGAPELEAGQ